MQAHIVKSFDTEIQSLRGKICQMAQSCEDQIQRAAQAFINRDVSLAQKTVTADDAINQFQIVIEEDTVRLLAKRQPMAVDLRQLLSAIKIASEFERIGDYAANITKRVAKLSGEPSPEIDDLIIRMAETCQMMVHGAIDAFLKLDIQKAIVIWQTDDTIDSYFADMMELARRKMKDRTDTIEDCTQLIFMGRCLERIGDHVTNIVENIYYISTGRTYISQFEEQ